MEPSELRSYCRIDDDIEDNEVIDMQKAAEDYLANAGIVENYMDFRYKLAVKMMVCHWYDNRGAIIAGSLSKELEFGLDTLITQMQLSPMNVAVGDTV